MSRDSHSPTTSRRHDTSSLTCLYVYVYRIYTIFYTYNTQNLIAMNPYYLAFLQLAKKTPNATKHTAVWIVAKTQQREHIAADLIKLHWLPIKCCIIFNILTLIYKCLSTDAPHTSLTYLKSISPQAILHPHQLQYIGHWH